jgi:hypothetical protein
VSELAADGIPVAVTCRVLKIARQPYYRWLLQPVTPAELAGAYRANALFDAHQDDPEFGYRFLVDEAADAGQVMAGRTAWRICSANGWWSIFGKKARGKGLKSGPPVHDDMCAVVDDKGRSGPRHRIGSGSATSPSTAPGKASSTSARSRTSTRTGSWATRSTPR